MLNQSPETRRRQQQTRQGVFLSVHCMIISYAVRYINTFIDWIFG